MKFIVGLSLFTPLLAAASSNKCPTAAMAAVAAQETDSRIFCAVFLAGSNTISPITGVKASAVSSACTCVLNALPTVTSWSTTTSTSTATSTTTRWFKTTTSTATTTATSTKTKFSTLTTTSTTTDTITSTTTSISTKSVTKTLVSSVTRSITDYITDYVTLTDFEPMTTVVTDWATAPDACAGWTAPATDTDSPTATGTEVPENTASEEATATPTTMVTAFSEAPAQTAESF